MAKWKHKLLYWQSDAKLICSVFDAIHSTDHSYFVAAFWKFLAQIAYFMDWRVSEGESWRNREKLSCCIF